MIRFRFLCVLGVAFAVFAPLEAARGQLAASSPFLPPDAKGGPGGGAPAGPIELRGIMTTPEGTRYCIYDTTKRTSQWVGLNEKGQDFVVKSQDSNSATEAVTVLVQGRTMHLTLHTARVASAGAPMPAAVGAPNNAPAQASAVLNPTNADNARRLEAVAAEVQRRRLLREQALQGAAPGGQPGAPPPAAPGTPGMPNPSVVRPQ